MASYGLHGKLQARAGQGTELASILLEAAQLLSAAAGCQIYLVSLDTADPDAVWITEVWGSEQDHDNALSVDKVRALITRAMPLLAAAPQQGQQLQVIGGKGLTSPAES